MIDGGSLRETRHIPTETDVHVPRWLAQAAAISWRVIVIVTAISLVVIALVRLRLLFLPIFVALLASTLLVPLANRLKAKRWPAALASFAVLAAAIVVVSGVVALLAPQVADELDEVGQSLKAGTERVIAWLTEGPLGLEAAQIDNFVDTAAERLRANSSQITSGVVAGAVVIGEAIAGLLLTLVLLFFFIKDGDKIATWALSLVAPSRRALVRKMGARGWEALTGYVRGTAIIALVDAILIGIGLFIVGVPLVVPLMVLTFLGAFFPLVGAVLAGAVAALVALVTTGPLDALIVVAIVTVIQQVEGDVLQPVVMGRSVNLHPLAVLLSLTAGAILGGIPGAFVAVPVTAVIAAAIGVARGHGAAHDTVETPA
ncbi:MAG: AI-2E family transporter [Actinomycetota bacterium]